MGFWKLLENEKIKKYKAVIEKSPDDAEAHFYLGSEYERSGKIQLAIDEFRETIRINRNSAEGHYNLAVLYETLKDGKNAVTHCLKAGNLFAERNDTENKDKARKMSRELCKKYNFKMEDFKNTMK